MRRPPRLITMLSSATAATLIAGLALTAPAGAVADRAAPDRATPNSAAPDNAAPDNAAPDNAAAAGELTPPPRELTPRGDGFPLTPTVGLVRGAQADADAERVVRDTLALAGVTMIKTTDGTDPGTPVTVWLGDGAAALSELKVQPATGLGTEGYVLAAGADRQDRKHIVLDGVDTDGTFYAAQSLRQLVQPRPGTDRMPGVAIRDWPTLRYRGSIEGFYGTPWSHADRLDHVGYLGEHKMNTYEYAPKDDPYHRERWRDPYPADKLAELGELVTRANQNKVDFTFALSPGLDLCFTSESDFQALVAKFQAVYDLGGRSFNVPFDDIDYNSWHCDADRAKYGTGGGAAGRAQSEILNRVQREWVETKPDVAPLQMVPTEYYNTSATAYKQALREQLDSDVVVHWTGIGVIPRTITAAQAQQARQVFGHDILIWDNYPVNDYIAGRIPLADYSGRAPGIADHIAGIISNPMNQAAVSKVALYSFGEFGWHTAAYDEELSWHRALTERAGGDRRTLDALKVFADLNTYDTTLHPESAPQLAQRTAAFWQTWNRGDEATAIAGFMPHVRAIEQAPAQIRAGVTDPAFAAEAKSWLDATELWGAALRESLNLLDNVAVGNGQKAWTARQRIDALVAQAKAIRDTRLPHRNTYPRIGERVLDEFLAEAGRVHDRWLGIQPGRTAGTSLATYSDNVPARMIDGDLDTWFWSNGAPQTNDEIRVDLGGVRAIGDIAVLMGKSTSPNDYIHSGVLEWSANGSSWTELTRATTAEVRATAPAGTQARYVRYRALAPNPDFWLVVREFQVQVTDGSETTLTATGTPAPATGSSLARAVDGNLSSSYDAATAPVAGDALTVTLSGPRTLTGVTVLQRDGAAGTGQVEIRSGGTWRAAGSVSASYGAVNFAATTADAIRVLWSAGGTPPKVAEVIPRLG